MKRSLLLALVLFAPFSISDAIAQSVADSGRNLVGTVWALANGRGLRCELRFEARGAFTLRRLNAKFKRDPHNEFHSLGPIYEVATERGDRWMQDGNSLSFWIVDTSSGYQDADKNWVQTLDAYSGSIQGSKVAGKAESRTWGHSDWSAIEVKEPKDREDGPPAILLAIQPPYPLKEAMDSGKDGPGSVTVLIDISAKGTVSKVTVKKSSAEMFSKTTVDAVSHWEFLPAIKNSIAVPGSVEITIQFVMHKQQ